MQQQLCSLTWLLYIITNRLFMDIDFGRPDTSSRASANCMISCARLPGCLTSDGTDHSSLLQTEQGDTCPPAPPWVYLQETCRLAGALSRASLHFPPTTDRPHVGWMMIVSLLA